MPIRKGSIGEILGKIDNNIEEETKKLELALTVALESELPATEKFIELHKAVVEFVRSQFAKFNIPQDYYEGVFSKDIDGITRMAFLQSSIISAEEHIPDRPLIINGRSISLIALLRENYPTFQIDPIQGRAQIMREKLIDILKDIISEHKQGRDYLTGLLNRARFDEMLREFFPSKTNLRRINEAYCVMYMDLDGFKAVNETYGHAAGDDILKQVATLLNGSIRGRDNIHLFRTGGDEFTIILAKDLNTAKGLGIRIQNMISNHQFKVKNRNGEEILLNQGAIKISIGVAESNPEYDDSPEAIAKRSDNALHESKDLKGKELTHSVVVDLTPEQKNKRAGTKRAKRKPEPSN